MEILSKGNSSQISKENKNDFLTEYLNIVKVNKIMIVIIISVVTIASVAYAISLNDIFIATTTLKISEPNKNVLESPFPEFTGNSLVKDRFIANEIQTMYNVTLRRMVAQTIRDSIEITNNKDMLKLFLTDDNNSQKTRIISINGMAGKLSENVEIIQPGGLDFIEISAKSPSPKEAALIANSYADAYRRFNLLDNRKQYANVKEFLKTQAEEKQSELIDAENRLKMYQLQGGAIELDKQATSLIGNLTEFEAKKNAVKIEFSIIEDRLNNLKKELNKKDPSLSTYLESKSTEPYLAMLQDQIARVETQKDIFQANKSSSKNPNALKEYDATLKELKNKLKTSTDEYQKMILSSGPDEIKKLMQNIFEDEVQYQALKASYNQINNVLNSYEGKFSKLPDKALELARLERERLSTEKLYSILEEKYQEALLNEQSTPGNIFVLSYANPPGSPSEPNRIVIALSGLLFGSFLSLVFVYIKSYFDDSVKSPDDITRKNINLIGWIPKIEANKSEANQLVVVNSPNSIPSEAFKTLRTRVQFSKLLNNSKVILITSSAPNEGKTFVCSNLGASFAAINIKTVILDCDLRIPKLHTFFNEKKSPGFVDFFVGEAYYEEIVRQTDNPNLYYIPAGTTPPNPSEILSSSRMKTFIQKLRNEFDLVIIDSPPIMAVADSEILLDYIDSSLLVISAGTTKVEWMMESISLLLKDRKNSFMGTLLNKFSYKSNGYRSKYNYYNYYSSREEPKKEKNLA